jgi:hypothetical protein
LSADVPAARPPELRATERWFIRRGLPMFVEDYSAGRDVWTRALPALVALFVLMALAQLAATQSWLAAGLYASVLMVFGAAYVVWNRRRHAKPWALPDSVTPAWLVLFVAVPALLTLTTDLSLDGLVAGVLGPLLLLGIVYVMTRYALVALTAWALRWTFAQLSGVTELVTRVLPLMLLVLTFLYLSPGVWQVMGSSNAVAIAGTLLILGVIGVLFIVTRARKEFASVEESTGRDGVLEATERTPLEDLAPSLPGLGQAVPMTKRQRVNVHLVMVVAQIVQVALIGIVVWAFFVVFGAVAIRVPVQEQWLRGLGTPQVLWSLSSDHAVTAASIRVAAFLGGFAAFYATVYAATDKVYRRYFAEGISRDLSRALAVRRAYLAARRVNGLPAPAPLVVDPTTGG